MQTMVASLELIPSAVHHHRGDARPNERRSPPPFHPITARLVSFPGKHLGADFPDILHIGDDQHSAIHNHSE